MSATDPTTLLREIIEGIGQPFYAVDADWRFRLYNREAEGHFGRPAGDMIGKCLWDVFPGDSNNERGRVLRDAMAARRVVKGEAQSMVEGRIVSYCMFPLEGGMGVTFRDVTDRRRAEERRDQAEETLRRRTRELEAVLETIPTAVWFSSDRDLRQVVGNRRAIELLHLPREVDMSQALGDPRSFRIFRDGKELPPSERPLHRAARGEVVANELLEVAFNDGERRFVLLRAAPLRGPSGELQGAVCAGADVTERHRYEEHLRLLLNELNHRVKNTLAIVQAIASLTFKDAEPTARADFEQRLTTLGAVHGMLVDQKWTSASLGDVVRMALGSHHGSERVRQGGDEFRLNPRSAVAVSMALHELVTNAVKYGALSNEAGTVSVQWSSAGGRFRLTWQERGGPGVVPPRSRGFGSRMVEQGLAGELQGDVRIDFRPEGVVCTIDAPLDAIRQTSGP